MSSARPQPNATLVPMKNEGLEQGGATGGDGCLERVPYASLMATASILIGVLLFTLMMTWGFNASVEQARRLLQMHEWQWLDMIQIFFISLATLMVVFTLYLLAVGVSATGSTREQMFKGASARVGGRVACAFAIALSVLLFAAWALILSLCAVLSALYYVFDGICNAMPSFTDSDCIDLSVGRPLVHSFSDASLRICGGDAQQFCALSSTAFAWFIVGWCAALIVMFGLLQFVITHTANYSHVNNANRYVELRDVAYEAYTGPPFYRSHGYGDDSSAVAPPPPSTSSSRQAERHSESVPSQYAYGRRLKREY